MRKETRLIGEDRENPGSYGTGAVVIWWTRRPPLSNDDAAGRSGGDLLSPAEGTYSCGHGAGFLESGRARARAGVETGTYHWRTAECVCPKVNCLRTPSDS